MCRMDFVLGALGLALAFVLWPLDLSHRRLARRDSVVLLDSVSTRGYNTLDTAIALEYLS